MADSTTTFTFIVLLGLGLFEGLWDQVQAGVVPKPSIWADPGPIVTNGSSVTIWCQGSLQASAYVLYKERGSEPWETRIPKDSSNKAGFLIGATTPSHAGLYQCAYYSTGNILSEQSDPLILVVTGVGRAPFLSAQTSPVVASGGNVRLSCFSPWFIPDSFHLLKEGGADHSGLVESEPRFHRWWMGRNEAIFPLGPVNTTHGGTYRCYGSQRSNPNVWSQPSAPLHIEVTGVYKEPALTAQPGTLMLSGHSLTLQCHAEAGFDRFALTKDEGLTHPWRLDGQRSPDFPLGHVNRTHGGRYRCYSGHQLSSAWSAPSAPLDILVAGMSRKPSFSAQPGPSVPWGATLTLQCGAESWLDTFHLHREGSLDPPQHLRLQNTSVPSQATFTLSPVTSGHQGTYRCYGSNSSSPYLLSQPSDPLELVVSESGCLEPHPQETFPYREKYPAYGQGTTQPAMLTWRPPGPSAHLRIRRDHAGNYMVENLIRMGVAGLVLVVLGVLLFQARKDTNMALQGARM